MKGFNIFYLLLLVTGLQAQPMVLSLDRTISLATDSSLEAFRNKNLYLASYWEFRSYKAGRLPSLNLTMTPAQYYRDIVQRYDSEEDIDIYRKQQSFFSYGGLDINQNIDLLGGQVYVNSDIGYLRSFGTNTYSQITTIPVRIGYIQQQIGYNPFRWEKKIEPLKYEKAKKELLYNIEAIGETATGHFFNLAMAQAEYELALENVLSTDTLYKTGERRHKIAAISHADLLTLRLDAVNARNTLRNAEIALKRASFSLASFLNFDQSTELKVLLPSRPRDMIIPVDKALVLARENNPLFLEQKQKILEAEQLVDKTRKEALFNASISASIGFNQVGANFREAYRHPLQQDIVSVSLSIPLVDWGVRKGKYNMAKNTLNVTRISAHQEELTVEEEVLMTVEDFNIQQDLIDSAEEVLDLANMAYAETRQRFIIGKADINSLTLSLNRQQEAQRNYIIALQIIG